MTFPSCCDIEQNLKLTLICIAKFLVSKICLALTFGVVVVGHSGYRNATVCID